MSDFDSFRFHQTIKRECLIPAFSSKIVGPEKVVRTFFLTKVAHCTSFVDIFFLCPVLLMLSRLFIAALWSPAGKGLNSWLLLVMFIVFLLLPHNNCILGQVWYLIAEFPDICHLSFFY